MIHGFYFRTLFRNEKDGYTVFLLKTDTEMLSMSGHLPPYTLWTPLSISAEPDSAGKLHVLKLSETSEGLPLQGLDSFLRENGLSGPSDRRAFLSLLSGRELYSLIQQPGFIAAAGKLIGPEPASDLRKRILLPRQQRLFSEYLVRLIGKPASSRTYLFNRYVEEYRGSAISHFHLHLYQVCSDHLGFSFREADQTARKLGICLPDERVKALGTGFLSKARRNGNTCVPVRDLVGDVCKALYETDGTGAAPSDVERLLKCSTGLTVGESSGYIALQTDYQAEKIAADSIRLLLDSARTLFEEDELHEIRASLEKELGIQYAPAQQEAFRLLRHTGVSILTGGPGTGKTTTLNGLIRAYVRKYPDNRVVLTAPTGRAAQRMSEATGLPACTVHKLAGIGGCSRRGKNVLDADLLIIDESSMLDTEMISWLFSSVNPETLVLLVGDADQLPSVGPGDVLRNLTDSEQIPVCRLQTVYRQQGESLIVRNAQIINRGETSLEEGPDFRIIRCLRDEEIPDQVKEAVLESLKAQADPLETQVLCTAHSGAAGIESLNRILQELLNPPETGRKSLKFGTAEFRMNDKVITTSNNYTLGYCNGDIGFVTGISSGELTVRILNKEISIPVQDLKDVSLAYCISIHKSQGSEFGNAVVVLPGTPSGMLKRNLLYTAVTRARSSCTVIAASGAVEKCCRNADRGSRITRLCEKIFS